MRRAYGILAVFATAGLFGCTGGSGDGGGRADAQRPAPASPVIGAAPAVAQEDAVDDAVPPGEGWGHWKGRFVVVGAPPPSKLTVSGQDVDHCGKFTLMDESVLASPTGGLANVVLMLQVKRGEQPPEPHEQYAASAGAELTLDNAMCRFSPRVQLLRTTQTLRLKNGDTVGHNVNIRSSQRPINPLLRPNQSIGEKFSVAEREPAPITCNIHPWMQGWLVVRDSPYMALTNEEGEFMMENLPAGKHTFQVWHEKAKFLTQVEVGGQSTRWTAGRVEVTIRDGQTTDLGEVKIAYRDLIGR